MAAPIETLLGFDSSSTNIASDHGAGNARRSIAITSGRSEYPRRRSCTSALSRAGLSSVALVDLRIGKPHVHRGDLVRRKRIDRFRQPAHVKGVHGVKP